MSIPDDRIITNLPPPGNVRVVICILGCCCCPPFVSLLLLLWSKAEASHWCVSTPSVVRAVAPTMEPTGPKAEPKMAPATMLLVAVLTNVELFKPLPWVMTTCCLVDGLSLSALLCGRSARHASHRFELMGFNRGHRLHSHWLEDESASLLLLLLCCWVDASGCCCCRDSSMFEESCG